MSLGAPDLIRILVGAETAEEAAARTGDDLAALRSRLATLNPGGNPVLPVSVDTGAGQVAFQEFQATRFVEPFLADTALAAREALTQRLQFSVSMEDLRNGSRAADDDPGLFILHTGRAGSTLLTNLLTTAARLPALKEPDAISDLLAAWLGLPATDRDGMVPDIAAITRLLVRGARRLWGDGDRPVIVKLAAWNVVAWPALLKAFPHTPIVFLHRAPDDVVSSLIASRPAWFDLVHAPQAHQSKFFPSIRGEMHEIRDPVALFSHAWRSIMEAAADLPPSTIRLTYGSLKHSPTKALDTILQRIAITPRAFDTDHMNEVLCRYSKSNDPSEVFDAKGRHSRQPLDKAQRRTVARITSTPPEIRLSD